IALTPRRCFALFSPLRGGVRRGFVRQGCSERNISCVVQQGQSAKALRAVHSAFLLSHLTVSVGLVGAGAIGASLLGMLVEQREVLRTQFHLDVQIRAVASADKVCASVYAYG
ncbi:unnamed protein product, partial [Hapterophycus canaliculatus]